MCAVTHRWPPSVPLGMLIPTFAPHCAHDHSHMGHVSSTYVWLYPRPPTNFTLIRGEYRGLPPGVPAVVGGVGKRQEAGAAGPSTW